MRIACGLGLSYTSFSYSDLKVSGSSPYDVGVTIKNTGVVHGAEVVQLYLGFPALAGEPPQVLRGFKKLHLSPGAESTATFNLGTGVSDPDACACHHESADRQYVLKRPACVRRICPCGMPRVTNGRQCLGSSTFLLARRAATFCSREASIMYRCSGPRWSCSSERYPPQLVPMEHKCMFMIDNCH